MDLSKIHELSDALFFLWVFFITFSKYLVNPYKFYPAEFSAFIFGRVSYFGFSPTPRLFWIGAFFLVLSVFLRVIEGWLDWAVDEAYFRIFDASTNPTGEEYMEKHGIKRFED